MRFASLGSGSDGNGLVVESGNTRLLLDCGFRLKDVVARLARLGMLAEQLDGILVTHEHEDHVGGVGPLARKFGIPVYITYGTLAVLRRGSARLPQTHLIDSYTPFAVGDIEVHPYPVPHDAREPAQYVFSDGQRRLGVLTDVGCATAYIEQTLSGLDALVLECNHDHELLMNGPYPHSLKQRIAGRNGHLANDAAAALVRALDCSRLQHFVAAHLSHQNNTPELARRAMAEALNTSADWIAVASQETGFDWRQIA
ncbi:MAG TPA: MBL fold metallo-hydrolase [Burkholderiales bacterium]